MKVIADTNLLVRIMVRDDVRQAILAMRTLREADLVIISTACLCELVWVLKTTYRFSTRQVSEALHVLSQAETVRIDAVVLKMGLQAMAGGCDFADGVIAHEGRMAGGDTFVSFDKRAVASLKTAGYAATLLR